MKRRQYIRSAIGASFVIPFTSQTTHARTIEDAQEPLDRSNAWVKRYDELTVITVVVPDEVGSTIHFDFDTGDGEKSELFERGDLLQANKEPAENGMVAYDFAHQFVSEDTSVYADGVEIDTKFSQLQGEPSYDTVGYSNYIGDFSWFGMAIGGQPEGVFSRRTYFIEDKFERVIFEISDSEGNWTEYEFEVENKEEAFDGEPHKWSNLHPVSESDAYSDEDMRKSHRRRLWAVTEDGTRHKIPFLLEIEDMRDE